jgi:hypothetical protein
MILINLKNILTFGFYHNTIFIVLDIWMMENEI